MPLASALAGGPVSFVNADVALDGEPVVGSFTVDGLTFAVAEGSNVELVGVSAGAADVVLPESVSFEGADYALTSIAPYAFYLSGVTSVELPATVTDVDDRAFRSSDVSSVEVDPSNEAYASFDGILYDADFTRLLLIPGGRTGAARISSKAEEVDAAAFSHCAGVTAISVDAGSDHLSSWEGLLYDADGTTLIRVPAGATDITIREGCTTIAAGALEGCASLAAITAPASVTSISPDVFASVPTVSLPAATLTGEAPQLTALVALSATDDDLPKVGPTDIAILLPDGGNAESWQACGFVSIDSSGDRLVSDTADSGQSDREGAGAPSARLQSADKARNGAVIIHANGGLINSGYVTNAGYINHTAPVVQWQFSGMNFYAWTSTAIQDSCRLEPRTDCTFLGWSLSDVNPAATFTEGWYPIGAVANIWANWRVKLTWNPNGGYWGSASDKAAKTSNNDNATTATSYNNATLPTRTGYTFKGWSTSSTATAGATSVTVPNSPATYYAVWAANSYTVEYWNKVGTTKLSTDTGFKYDTARNLAAKPSSGVNAGYTAVGWATSANQSTAAYGFSSSQKNLVTSGTKKLYLAETANSYTVEYWNKAGTTKLSSDTGFKYDTARNLAAKPTTGVNAGYTAVGWATSTNQSKADYSFGSSQKNLVTSGTKKLYLAETANPITLTWNSNGGSAVASTTQTYSPTAKVALPANPTKAGYTFAGWWTAPTGGVQVTSSTALPTANATYYAHWSLNPYEISYELDGGAVSGNPTTYDVTTTTFTLKNPTRTGYVFTGWSGTGLTGEANMTVSVAKGSTGNRFYTAHWLPAISADIPLEVTAQVDLLGIEEQQEAAGYIESRCGEPLGVAAIELSPLSGATELFGAANVADVALEVLVAGSISPDARFALDASASQAPATPAAFRMASYGTRVPISYRFDIPDELLPSLVETTKPVCSVAYTVKLA